MKVAKIHGDISPRERKRVMRQVQNLEFQYVVATDLASRGIDIEGVSHVINAKVPQDLDFFIHRVGRTGRNGLSGTAITLYSPSDENDISLIENLGIHFQPKEIKIGEISDTYDRNRRKKREKSKDELDPTLIGLVKKSKKKSNQVIRKKLIEQFQNLINKNVVKHVVKKNAVFGRIKNVQIHKDMYSNNCK